MTENEHWDIIGFAVDPRPLSTHILFSPASLLVFSSTIQSICSCCLPQNWKKNVQHLCLSSEETYSNHYQKPSYKSLWCLPPHQGWQLEGTHLARMEEHDSPRLRTKCCLLTKFIEALPPRGSRTSLEQLKANWEPWGWKRPGAGGKTKGSTGQAEMEFMSLMSPLPAYFHLYRAALPCPPQFPVFFSFFPFFKCSLIPSVNWCSLCVRRKKISLFFCLFFLLLPLAQFIIFLSCHSVW